VKGQGCVSVLVITGPVGVGKTTVAYALSDALSRREVPHALLDMDALRECRPAPAEDPFNIALSMKNLAAVWANFRAAGAERLVIADVVERREQRAGYEAAVPKAQIQIVRLCAPVPTIHRRLEGRETGDSLQWHKHRAVELTELMDRRRIGDLHIDTEGKPVERIASEILSQTGWLQYP
jgi:adenylylsulfate kinase